MKTTIFLPLLAILVPVAFAPGLRAQEPAIDPERAANTIILDEAGVENLRLETVLVEERDFESTVFAIGRVEEIPNNHYAVSSRIAGIAVEVNAFTGDRVRKGDVVVKVESRLPGDPPPVIELRAPIDGLVTETDVLQGQPVEPDVELLDISDRSEMWVVARIPEERAHGIDIGSQARITFPAVGGEPISAELVRFGVEADREAGVIEGIFVVPNGKGRLFPGMRAELEIIIGKRSNVMAVPEEAIQGDPASRVLYVKDFELPNAFVRVPAVLGERGGGWVEVKRGLFPGDEVVTRGSYSLGFVGGDSGMSLKEALDAAHGHEHNEDGSEMTAEQKAARDAGDGHDHGAHGAGGGAPGWLRIYAIASTALLLFFVQLWWNARRKPQPAASA